MKLTFKTRSKFHVADGVGMAILAGVTLVFIFGLIAPLAMRERQAAARADSATRQQQRANAVTATIREASVALDQVRAKLAEAPVQLRPVNALNERVASLVTLGSDCGLIVQDIRPGEVGKTRKFASVPIHLAGQGSYPNVTRFLRRLHQELPDMGVSNLKLTGAPDDAAIAARYEFELRWIAMPQEITATPAQLAATPVQ
ncbi:MAG: hypothetical protein JWM57_1915 [Phycisphaerales bacterium]|nr:hypothetical protein [Phycisphaerales bacterium]